MKTELVKAEDFGIEKKQEIELLSNLPQIKAERDILEVQYNEIIRMDIESPETWQKASDLRILIQKNRTQGINVWHKNAKDFFLKGGQFVDAIKRKEIKVNERMEAALIEIEKFEQIQKNKKIAELNELRITEIEPFSEFLPFGINLGEMAEEDYQKLLKGAKMQFEAEQKRLIEEEKERVKIEKIAKLHNERKEMLLVFWDFVEDKTINFGELTNEQFSNISANAEKLKNEALAEQQRIKLENARLEKERLEAEKEREKERAEAEAKAKAIQAQMEKERKAKLALELAIKQKAEKAAKELEEERERAEALKKAPIKTQLTQWINDLEMPEINIENKTKDDILNKFEAFKKWAKLQIDNL